MAMSFSIRLSGVVIDMSGCDCLVSLPPRGPADDEQEGTKGHIGCCLTEIVIIIL